jgi:hypothetical protein
VSIIVALTGRRCGVIATDRRRVEMDCQFVDNFPKNLRLSASVIAGYAGLLEVNGQPVADSLKSLFSPGYTKIDGLVDQTKAFFETALTVHPHGPLESRRLSIVFLALESFSEPTIRTVFFEGTSGRMRGIVNNEFTACCEGDERSKVAIRAELNLVPPHSSLSSLQATATRLVRKGIEQAAFHEFCPNVRACGGEPSLVWCQRN